MSTRRIVLGRQADGTYGMRCALPGNDALTADANDADALSFNSDWDSPLYIHMVGVASVGHIATGIGSVTIPFPALPYIPYADIRSTDGNVVYDDRLATLQWFTASSPANPVNCTVTWLHAMMASDHIRIGANVGATGAMYAVYKKST